jgi:alpha-beta hydrolase superfamily lysophospholipase
MRLATYKNLFLNIRSLFLKLIKSFVVVVGFLLINTTSYAATVDTFFHPFFEGRLRAKVLIVNPENQEPVADIIFLTGYYDRPDNHIPQFTEWSNKGFRVISFAYPGHDENTGSYNILSLHNFRSLFQMLIETERITRVDQSRPLALAGWSLGGEVVIRFIQTEEYLQLGRGILGLVLQAPSVAVKPVVGEFGVATRRTLTTNIQHPFGGPLKPRSPMIHLPFTGSLVANCLASFCAKMPKEIPMLVQTAGNDKYVWSYGVHQWVNLQRKTGASIQLIHYPDAMHMLDAESPDVAQAANGFLVAHCARYLSQPK